MTENTNTAPNLVRAKLILIEYHQERAREMEVAYAKGDGFYTLEEIDDCYETIKSYINAQTPEELLNLYMEEVEDPDQPLWLIRRLMEEDPTE